MRTSGKQPLVYVNCPCRVGESPRWRQADRSLYWVDIAGGAYFRHRDGTPAVEYERADPQLGKIGSLAFAGQDRMYLFAEKCRIWGCRFGREPSLVAELAGYDARRFNDVWEDAGSFFCGIAQTPDCRGELWLWRGGKFTCLERDLTGMPNGIGVSPDGKTLYFIVSDERRIYAYDYARTVGALSNKRILCADFRGSGVPDGLAVDPLDGSIYVAIWGGARVEKRSPDGSLAATLEMPCELVTSVAVEGRRLFVTTGNKADDFEQNHRMTGAGAVFCIDI